jgi:hypothetical protein
MNNAISYVQKSIVCTLLSMVVTAIISFIIMRKLEVVAGASLFGLFILPSIIVYYVLDFFHKTQKAKIIGFIMPILAILALFVVGLLFTMTGKYNEDGEDQMATLILANVFFAGSILYFLMSKVKWLK